MDKSGITVGGYANTVDIATAIAQKDYDIKSITLDPGKYIINAAISTNNVDTIFMGKLFVGSNEITAAYARGSSIAGITFFLNRAWTISSPTTLKLVGGSFSISGKITGYLLDYIKIAG